MDDVKIIGEGERVITKKSTEKIKKAEIENLKITEGIVELDMYSIGGFTKTVRNASNV